MKTFVLTQLLVLLISAGVMTSGNATELYKNDFEDPIDFSPKPVWGISPVFGDVYGPGNNFETTQAASHSGSSSLKFNYNGRNGMCNLCGFTTVTHKNGLDNSPDFVTDTGEDLTTDPFFAKKGRIIINKTNGYSKWKIDDIVNYKENGGEINNKLVVTKLNDGISGDPAEFNSGDSVFIARQCGVDGNAVKNNVRRRTDCNKVISWFYGVETNGVSSQAHNHSIFRRIYLKAEISSSNNHSKLRYWRLPNDNIILLGQTTKGATEPRVAGFSGFSNGGDLYKPGTNMPDIAFERGKWYYVEEEFHTESTPGAGDGYYKLWFAEAGTPEESLAAPAVLFVDNLTLPPVIKASLWGNIQHTDHTIGVWYMDDIEISSDTRIGPLVIPDDDVAAPGAPATTPP